MLSCRPGDGKSATRSCQRESHIYVSKWQVARVKHLKRRAMFGILSSFDPCTCIVQLPAISEELLLRAFCGLPTSRRSKMGATTDATSLESAEIRNLSHSRSGQPEVVHSKQYKQFPMWLLLKVRWTVEQEIHVEPLRRLQDRQCIQASTAAPIRRL